MNCTAAVAIVARDFAVVGLVAKLALLLLLAVAPRPAKRQATPAGAGRSGAGGAMFERRHIVFLET